MKGREISERKRAERKISVGRREYRNKEVIQ